MDPELNDDDVQLRGDLTDAERTAADKMHDDAFAAAFADDGVDNAGPADEQSPAPAPVAAQAPTPSPAPAPSVNDEDPFKAFSPKVREMFAKIPELENDNRSLRGRVPVLQRENEDLKRRLSALESSNTPPPAAPAPDAPRAIDKVRGELPEVADAIEEAFREREQQRAAAPAPSAPTPAPAPATQADPEADAMNAAHPDWMPTMNSADFKLWVAVQGDEFSQRINDSRAAAPVIDAITKFKAHQSAAAARVEDTQQRRNRRASQAVTPPSSRAPVEPGAQTEHDAFLAGFNSP